MEKIMPALLSRNAFSVALLAFFALFSLPGAQAALTDLASAPLASTSNTSVRPNTLFVLDDSGSMGWEYLPDYVGGGGSGIRDHCKPSNKCSQGITPFMANEYNGVMYNPRVAYLPPVNADGTLKNSMSCVNTGGSAGNCAATPYTNGWTAVKVDGYGVQSTGTINMTTGYSEEVYCNGAGTECKRNGVDTQNPFALRATEPDNPPLYAFPGSLTSSNTVLSTVHNGSLNKASTTSGTIYNGTLNVSTASTTLTLSGVTVVRSGSSSTVNVTYTATTPALATGDTVVVSGSTCSSGYRSGGNSRTITVTDSTHFSYSSNSGSGWSNTSCTIVATKPAVTASTPRISKSGTTVTVELASAPTPALATGSLVTVANGSGTCDAGYRASGVSITRISSTSFSYPVATAVGTATNASCNITQVANVVPSSPGIGLSGTTVTVYKSSHGLSTGDLVRVSDGSAGTCDNGYKTNGSVAITKIDSNTFTYSPPEGTATSNSNCKIDKMQAGTTTVDYSSASNVNANPYYFSIIPIEFCDSINLTNCVVSSVPTGSYTYPAPVRYCKNATTAALAPGNAGAQGSNTCQGKFSVGAFEYVRYGLFYRVDIVPSTANYGNVVLNGTISAYGVDIPFNNVTVIDRSARVGDGSNGTCAAAPTCTYAEEMTNFANWYAYYHTRLQMMKTSAGRAFLSIDDRFRVGFVTINASSSSRYLPVARFDATQKNAWYTKFYGINTNGSTPLREAVARAGRYFAGKHGLPGDTGWMTDDPMEYSCQQNFALVTTDGYWNGTTANVVDMNGSQLGNHDNVNQTTDPKYSSRSNGTYDGGDATATNTLADVAMYFYKNDLRSPAGPVVAPETTAFNNCTGALGVSVCQNNVPTTTKDFAAHQHMTTFSIGLVDGLLTYQPDYETALTGDFAKIKAGTQNWTVPVSNGQSALDDLWHAAVNGRGTYYNARDPVSLSQGLSGALAGMNIRLAAAAASSTSTPNITTTDRSIFSSTYRTSVWDGEVTAQLIDPTNGNVLPAVVWSAQTQLDAKVLADATTSISGRHIYTFDDTLSTPRTTNGLKDFLYANLTASEKQYFDNKCTSTTTLNQCSLAILSAAQMAQGNSGENMVNYLRGQKTLEKTTPFAVFRPREHLLGDTVNAAPAYVKTPSQLFTDAVTPSYDTFKSQNSTRQGVVYIPANDGMLHAFNSDTGNELWSYVPKLVMPNLYKLADAYYANNHRYYVDGSPAVMDIFVDSTLAASSGMTAGWHSILVAGLNAGGRGYYALDVTDPYNPEALWEICSDSTLCNISDADIGYSFGNPLILKRSTDGQWVVMFASGYNNVSPGTGKGFLFQVDLATGAILNKIDNGSGSTSSPSGLSKISAYFDSAFNRTARFIYGGDLNGAVWRFDLGAQQSAAAPTVAQIATLTDASGATQSITTLPVMADNIGNVNSLAATGNPIIYIGTGKYLGATDMSNQQVQSIYALKDTLSTASNLGNLRNRADTLEMTLSESSGVRSLSGGCVNWGSNKAVYFDLNLAAAPGERINIEPKIINTQISLNTNQPETSACTLGGYGRKFTLDLSLCSISDSTKSNELIVGEVVIKITTVDADGKKVYSFKKITTYSSGRIETTNFTLPTEASSRPVSWRELLQ